MAERALRRVEESAPVEWEVSASPFTSIGELNPIQYLVEFEAALKVGKWIYESGLAPAGVANGQACAVLILTGREFGMTWMQALRNFHVIKGKAVLSADAMAGLINQYCAKQGGGFIKPTTMDNDRCIVTYQRHDEDAPQTFEFTVKDAQQAGLIQAGGNWNKFPKAMCKARALSGAARAGWPEIVAGLYDPNELTDEPPATASVYVRPNPSTSEKRIEAQTHAEEPQIIEAEASPINYQPVSRPQSGQRQAPPSQSTNGTPKQADDAIIDASVVDKLISAAMDAQVQEPDLLLIIKLHYGAKTLQALNYGQARTLFRLLAQDFESLATVIGQARDAEAVRLEHQQAQLAEQ